MVKWAIELSKFDISYLSRSSIKAQVLVDFIIEYTIPKGKLVQEQPDKLTTKPAWILNVDRASNSHGYGAGLILTNSKGVINEYTLWFTFKASNNQAKCEALIANLKTAKELKVKRLKVFTDL